MIHNNKDSRRYINIGKHRNDFETQLLAAEIISKRNVINKIYFWVMENKWQRMLLPILARWRALAINVECFGSLFFVFLFWQYHHVCGASALLTSICKLAAFKPTKYTLLLDNFIAANASERCCFINVLYLLNTYTLTYIMCTCLIHVRRYVCTLW